MTIDIRTGDARELLDPGFVGWGSAMRAALELGRDGFGVEIDPERAELARAWCASSVQTEIGG